MKIKPWKRISSKEVFKHERMHMLEDVVELPNGEQTTYLRHAPATKYGVAVIAINNKNEILIQKEYSYPPNEVMWQLPGGEAKLSEDIIDAANRELSEESGLVGEKCEIIGAFYIDNRRTDLKQYIVLCTELKKKLARSDPEEFIESHWIPLSQLPEMIRSGEICSMSLLAALNLYFARIK